MINKEIHELLNDDIEELFQATMSELEMEYELTVVPTSRMNDWMQFDGEMSDFMDFIDFHGPGSDYAFVESISRKELFVLCGLGEYTDLDNGVDGGDKVESFCVVMNFGGVKVGTTAFSDFAKLAIQMMQDIASDFEQNEAPDSQDGAQIFPFRIK